MSDQRPRCQDFSFSDATRPLRPTKQIGGTRQSPPPVGQNSARGRIEQRSIHFQFLDATKLLPPQNKLGAPGSHPPQSAKTLHEGESNNVQFTFSFLMQQSCSPRKTNWGHPAVTPQSAETVHEGELNSLSVSWCPKNLEHKTSSYTQCGRSPAPSVSGQFMQG